MRWSGRRSEADGAAPSAALREEIADTFNAALADPEVAGRIEAGALVKAAHWAGFGFGFGSGPAAGPASAAFAAPAAKGKPAAKQAGPPNARWSRRKGAGRAAGA